MKFIILCTIFILSSFWCFPSFAMQYKQKKGVLVTQGLICEPCQYIFKTGESRVNHIIAMHYSCPWCDGLDYLDLGFWELLSEEEKQARVNHIQACAQKKCTSLWQCKQCFALSHYKKKEHRCGVQYQVNLITNKGLDVNEVLKISEMNTCRICSASLVNARACKNHMILRHTACPWCPIKLTQSSKVYKTLTHDERQAPFAHFIECAQRNNESLFACNQCYGIMLCGRAVHTVTSCSGCVYEASVKIKTRIPSTTVESTIEFQEWSLSTQERNSSNQFSNNFAMTNQHQLSQENDFISINYSKYSSYTINYWTSDSSFCCTICPSLPSTNSEIYTQSCGITGFSS